MIDIIQLSPSTFHDTLSRKSSTLYNDLSSNAQQQLDKVQFILDTFACFRDQFPTSNSSHVRHVYKAAKTLSNNKSSHYTSSYLNPKRDKTLSYTDKVVRETTALLNKVNESNKSIIKDKLLKFCDDQNIKLVANMILLKCYTQSYYLPMFLQVFEVLYIKFRTQLTDMFDEFKNNVQRDFRFDIEQLSLKNQTIYEEFCDFVLQKAHLIQKHKLVHLLESKKFIELDNEAYFSNNVSVTLQLQNEIASDVFVSILSELVHLPDKDGVIRTYMTPELIEKLKMFSSKKTFFKLCDLQHHIEKN